MISALVTAASLFSLSQASSPLADLGPDTVAQLAQCGVDETGLNALLELDQQAFDQDPDGGWRPLANDAACRGPVAELIAVWRAHSGNVTAPGILYWHEGQMRAMSGQTEAAADLFGRARSDSAEWNLYVDATIAFLEGDRAALEAARAALALMVPSEEIKASRRRFMEENPQFNLPESFVEQPQNLNVVDQLLDCFGSPYVDAYAGRCDAGAGLTPTAADGDQAACGFASMRFEAFTEGPRPDDVRNAVAADWLVLDNTREEVEDLIKQSGRDDGPDAPFAMGYRPDFARAVASISDEEIARFHARLTSPGAVACDRVNVDAPPFTDDLQGFLDWADDQMINPDPGAPEGAQTLSISRPVLFDDGHRALFAESYTYTPIPLSRPPSATLAFVVYVREDEDWTHEASMILARGG